MRDQTGFTLLEVLVALAVLAIAMGAITGAATQSVNSVGYLRDQTFAGWMALNKVNELLLDPKPWPDAGSRKGSADLANRTWRWEAQFKKTDDPDLSRLEVAVRAYENGPVLSALVAFKSRPPPDESTEDRSPSDRAPKSQLRSP
ncbi:MAG TPA: type II secretion system minor pseudopilin GspI [Candidatus Competibacter sp.]|nr:type II secretion system minor pseudopilin GspI [Candidatus Competibacter sp.]